MKIPESDIVFAIVTNAIAPVKTRDFLDFLATPIGGSTDTIGRYVLDFLKDLSLSNMPELRPFNRQAMVYEARAFLGKHPHDLAVSKEQIAAELPRDVEIEDGIERSFQELTPLFEREKDLQSIYAYWQLLESEKRHAIQEADPEVRQRRLEQLFCFLNRLGESLSLWQKDPSRNHEARNKAVRILASYITIRRVSARFQAVTALHHLNPANPEQISACFRALHESQRRAAFAAGKDVLDSLERERGRINYPIGFGAYRFSWLEFRMTLPEQVDPLLRSLWNGIKQAFPAGPPLIQNDSEAYHVRSWLNDPANRLALRRIVFLRVPRWRALPPEIGRFTALHDLVLVAGSQPRHKLTGLPEEMASLQELRSLDLFSRRPDSHLHNLREIPPVIGELRALEYLDLSGPIREIPEFLADLPHLSTLWIAGSQVRAIPDRVWRHVYLRNESLGEEFWRFLDPGKVNDETRATFGINPRQLTDVPFALWLKQFEVSEYLQLSEAFTDLLNECAGPASPLFKCLSINLGFVLFYFLVVLPFGGLTFILEPLINLPLFLYNIALRYVVEPLLTTARDALGYSRMVRV